MVLSFTVTLSPTRDQRQTAKSCRLSARAEDAEDTDEEDWNYSLSGLAACMGRMVSAPYERSEQDYA